MEPFSGKSFPFAGILLTFLLGFSSLTHSAESVSDKIKALNQQMGKVTEELSKERKKKSSIQEELRKQDLEIEKTNKKIAELDKKIATTQKELDAEYEEQKKLDKEIDAKREQLGKSLRAIHATGQQPDIKLLFNQNNMVDFQRLMTYYQLFNKSLQEQITDLNIKLDERKALTEKIENTKQLLENEKEEQKAEKEKLAKERKERTETLKTIEKSITQKDAKIKELSASENELQRVLNVSQSEQKKWPPIKGSFDKQKGKLRWPTIGKVIHTFGSYRSGGQNRYNGMVISAPEGQTIEAVAPGRVVYADWLRGYGLLVIIDHGNKYMSLYAHNDMLYTTLGSLVKDGDAIGTVGTTGGLKQPGLYFEIRHDGKPINPQLWLGSRGAR